MRFMIAHVLFGDQCTGEQVQHFIAHSSIHNTGVTVMRFANSYEDQDAFTWRLVTLSDFAHFAE